MADDCLPLDHEHGLSDKVIARAGCWLWPVSARPSQWPPWRHLLGCLRPHDGSAVLVFLGLYSLLLFRLLLFLAPWPLPGGRWELSALGWALGRALGWRRGALLGTAMASIAD
jgi:hypothetical protein